MSDFYLTNSGDISVSHSGDIQVATSQRDHLQQSYIRCMTDEGDFLLYPQLGASLSNLYGMPQSPATGQLGERLIESAMTREARFVGIPFKVTAVPTGPTSLRFDVKIIYGRTEIIEFSVEQDLIVDPTGPESVHGWPAEWIIPWPGPAE